MTKGAKKAILIVSITLIVLLLAGAIIVGTFIYGIKNMKIAGHSTIEHENLRAVMQDDVIYLSDDFFSSNNLEFSSIYSGKYGPRLGNVRIDYQDRKMIDDNTDLTKRIENIDSYSYELYNINEYDDDGKPAYLPYKVEVRCSVGNRDLEFDGTTDGGYKYKLCDFEELSDGYSKSCVILNEEKLSAFKKRYSVMDITVKFNSVYGEYFTRDEIEQKFNEVITSALANIERYQ